MATLALPINALLPAVDEANAETRQVVVCSKEEPTDKMIVVRIAWKTLVLRRRFADLAHRQTRLLNTMVQRDVSKFDRRDLAEMAVLVDKLVSGERDILQQAHQLGSEIRAWWHTSLLKLSDQVEHLESIAESFRVAADEEASALMGVAVGQFIAEEEPKALVCHQVGE
jgi:hypothetical protein